MSYLLHNHRVKNNLFKLHNFHHLLGYILSKYHLNPFHKIGSHHKENIDLLLYHLNRTLTHCNHDVQNKIHLYLKNYSILLYMFDKNLFTVPNIVCSSILFLFKKIVNNAIPYIITKYLYFNSYFLQVFYIYHMIQLL